MKNSVLKRVLSAVVTITVLASLAACGGKKEEPKAAEVKPTAAPAATAEPVKKADAVTIKFLSNLPDRNAGQGKLEQLLIDNYKKENPNVKIELETLQDEPYKQKFKAYTASNELPDFYMIWGQPAFFGPVMKAGYAAELNSKDYESYNFLPGALDGFSYNGKLHGLPRNTDFMVLYYNKGLFEKNGVKVPTNSKELLEAAKAFRAKGIAPCAMNGKDKWAIAILYHDLALKISGDQKLIYNAVERKTNFAKEESLTKGAKLLKELMDVKFFQDSFTSADYGAANNLFAQEKAAMYYMGSWEMGMPSNDKFPESFRKNVGVIRFPVVEGGKGKDTDLVAWNGGGYAISANSKVKVEAVKLMNYFFKPENWAKNAWQMNICVPAQKYDTFLTGQENELSKELTKILSGATSLSGVAWMDYATPGFKTDGENLSQELAAGVKTPEKFIEECDKAADKAAGK